MQVKALKTFADSQSPVGLRKTGDVFECDQERFDFLNGLHPVPLLEITEEPSEEPPANDELDAEEPKITDEQPKKPKRGGKKPPKETEVTESE